MKDTLENRVRQLEIQVENLKMEIKLLTKPLQVKGLSLESFHDELSYPGANTDD